MTSNLHVTFLLKFDPALFGCNQSINQSINHSINGINQSMQCKSKQCKCKSIRPIQSVNPINQSIQSTNPMHTIQGQWQIKQPKGKSTRINQSNQSNFLAQSTDPMQSINQGFDQAVRPTESISRIKSINANQSTNHSNQSIKSIQISRMASIHQSIRWQSINQSNIFKLIKSIKSMSSNRAHSTASPIHQIDQC